MDFGIYPPEINSARMYTGPGSAPMLTAAEAWEGLAAELHSAANSYQSVVSGLTAGPWLGPASTSMAAAAASYVAWLNATATQAEETAAQAKTAAAAYQTAFTVDGAAADGCGKPQSIDDAGGDEPVRPEHAGDCGQRSAIRRDVGAGHRGDVRLRSFVGIRDNTDTVHPTPTKHQPGRVGRPSAAVTPGHRHLGRQRAEQCRRFSKRSPRYPTRCKAFQRQLQRRPRRTR